MRLEDINLLDRDTFARGVPHEWLTYLRQNRPLYRHPEPRGPGFWVVTKYADVRAISRDPATFSSNPVSPLEELDSPAAGDLGAPVLIIMDPPEHTRYRRLVNRGFTPRTTKMLEPHVRELAVDIIERAIAKGSSDFVVDIASELPLEVIAELLGVPREDRRKIFHWTNQALGSADAGEVDPEYFVDDDEIQRSRIDMFTYVQNLCEQRRANPGDDVMSQLLDIEVDGDRLSDFELDAFFMFLSAAGNETTRNAATSGLLGFLEFPEQWDKLVQDPAGLSAGATEEILRWASPVMQLRRNVTIDTELRGQELKAGDKVSIWYMSANRDEAVFEDPFRFDIERQPNEHLAFGGGGPHFCLGASLARMELRVLFEELARRLPVLRAVGPPAPLRSNVVAGIKHLPVDLGASSAARSV
jgi:cholest-4-en-3-one 26-monooxygenase